MERAGPDMSKLSQAVLRVKDGAGGIVDGEPLRYHVLTWGCQMNDEDSEQMGLYLEQMGCTRHPDWRQADIVLLNTCSVRNKPEEKVFSKLGELREAKVERPSMMIGVMGCMTQILATEIARRAPQVDLVVGTGRISDLPDLVRQRLAKPHGKPLMSLSIPTRAPEAPVDLPRRVGGRTPSLRAHVPIMYGCDRFCAFCVVPLTRGRERSRAPEEVCAEVAELVAAGAREVTLLGQTVTSYGKNLASGRVAFAELLSRVSAVEGLERIRFTSPYPRDFGGELVAAIAELPKVCEHVHLPLQVAHDGLLRRMGRGYDMERYSAILASLRSAVPGIAVSTDLMLGYPGETEEEFQATMDYVSGTRFDSAFMFAYSPRPGTRAADLPDQVPHATKIRRLTELIELQNGITASTNAALAGSIVEVLVDGPSPRDPSRMSGLSRTFKTVVFPGETSLTGRLVRVVVEEGRLTGLVGRMVDEA